MRCALAAAGKKPDSANTRWQRSKEVLKPQSRLSYPGKNFTDWHNKKWIGSAHEGHTKKNVFRLVEEEGGK